VFAVTCETVAYRIHGSVITIAGLAVKLADAAVNDIIFVPIVPETGSPDSFCLNPHSVALCFIALATVLIVLAAE